jgi:hypothetical protein
MEMLKSAAIDRSAAVSASIRSGVSALKASAHLVAAAASGEGLFDFQPHEHERHLVLMWPVTALVDMVFDLSRSIF